MIGLSGEADTRDTQFVVSCNQSWMLYQALSIPFVALSAQDSSFAAITRPFNDDVSFPEIAARGPNQVRLSSQYNDVSGALSAWYPFVRVRQNVMSIFSGNQSDMVLVNGSCLYLADVQVYNCTWIASLKYVSQQVEISGIEWNGFETNNIIDNYVTAQSMYPGGLDIDQSTANLMGNRVEFTFLYTLTNSYQTFAEFASDITDALFSNDEKEPKNVFADSQDMNLVKSFAQPLSNGSVFEQFTISFRKAEQQKKVVALYASNDLGGGFSSYVRFYDAQVVASPAPITEAPKGKSEGSDSGSTSKTGLIAAVVVSVVVVIVIVAVIAKVVTSGKNKHFNDHDNDQDGAVLMTVV